ncbi:hypothetical protein B5K05_09785 [Rhizobium phaseoli]|uniref:hypothetical protein n=1 Tax=Rhizobium phaseoli TaxID=396 RepID=UPI00035CCD20|nr:hypothetical protein [Rhizobium phaseoli]RDJ13292.1 hypothetical protein B5K04_09755 [Rhizobium phaseoli]RDJ16434.1 hypothetical protein B5K05_09785 [Rhizobium phaseoli]
MVIVGIAAWVISTFKDELKEAFFSQPAPARVEQIQPPQNQPAPNLPTPQAMPMPSPPEPSQQLPMPQLNAVAPATQVTTLNDQWIPLAHDGDFKVQGITVSYAIYVKLGDRPPVVNLVVDGNGHDVRETGFANIIGDNGKACILKVKDVTKESLLFNLHCYE